MIGDKIKELRQENGINQRALAKEINVAQSIITAWENNIHEPKAAYIKSLAEFFCVSSDYLLGLEDEYGNRLYAQSTKPKPISGIKMGEIEKQILDKIQEIDEYQKQNVLGYINGLCHAATPPPKHK